MEKVVNEIPSSALDFLLLPVWVHKKLSVKFQGLVIAFLFVGTFDMVFYENMFKLKLFTGNPAELIAKLIVFLLMAFVIGAIDVACTMIPIADFASMIGRRSEKYVSERMPVILMKSYAVSHLLMVIPAAVFIYSGVVWENVNVASTSQDRLLLSIIVTLLQFLPYIQLGIIYRTLSVRTRIQAFGKLILILAAYFWMQLSSNAIFFFQEIGLRLFRSLF
ncbi:MAG: hypothetical protein N2376_06440 [Clostridia bacterium]|nr:hypothetical protein [Clostridia bacterium]